MTRSQHVGARRGRDRGNVATAAIRQESRYKGAPYTITDIKMVGEHRHRERNRIV